MRATLTALAVWLAALAAVGTAGAAEVHVAVAANFAAPLASLANGFTATTGHTLKVSSGATGKFYAQVRQGAPFDVLLAADEETPARLAAEGHALGATRFTYAVGELVLWSATPGFVDAEGAVLHSSRWRHLAIANPKTAPYGRAAMQLLQKRGLDAAALLGRLVMGESIAQTYQFVATGNAELGLVALSQVQRPGQVPAGSMWRVPPTEHSPIRQDAVLLNAGRGNPAATALLAYLKTEPALQVMRSFGYTNVGAR
ncbi:MAG: molybdate ABC transporter substrate-binding protein [Rubrivivax sp.]|nr:molybdate ABC transporter substrate-binding protein [Rubrivivax sp.]